MLAWYWVVLLLMVAGSFGASIAAILIAGAESERRKQKILHALEIEIIEDRRAEKTSVEFDGMRFAFPERLGLALSDMLKSLAVATGQNLHYHLPKESTRTAVQRTHRLTIG